MIKNILAVIGVLAIIAAGAALAVFKPWERPDIVAADGAAAPAVYFETLREDGLCAERIRVQPEKNRAVLYVSYSKFFKAPVLLRAFDKSGKEVGRSKRALSGDKEDAGYADFEFDARVPLGAVTFFHLTKSQSEAVPAEEIVPAQIVIEEPVAEPAPAPAPESVPAPVE